MLTEWGSCKFIQELQVMRIARIDNSSLEHVKTALARGASPLESVKI